MTVSIFHSVSTLHTLTEVAQKIYKKFKLYPIFERGLGGFSLSPGVFMGENET